MKVSALFVSLAIVLVLLAGCAPGPNGLMNTAGPEGSVAGFWRGLWNGVIAPVTFVISLFSRDVRMYEVHNKGSWYDLGFLIGMMTIFGSGAGGASARRSRR